MLPAETGSDSSDSAGAPPSVVQRSTDFRFLRELARRKGYEFFVRGGNAYFRPPDLSGEPQKLIAVRFGEETNCTSLRIEVDATRPTVAVMCRIDPATGETQEVRSESSELEGLGSRDLSEMRGFGAPQTSVMSRQQGAASEAQMRGYVQGFLRRHGWWIRVSGTLNGLRYGRVLRSRRTVTIKGLGQTHNGVYYVRKVIHRLTERTYEMKFEAVRNRLQQTGDEDFEGEHPSAVPVPMAAGAGADPDVIQVAEGGNVVLPA